MVTRFRVWKDALEVVRNFCMVLVGSHFQLNRFSDK